MARKPQVAELKLRFPVELHRMISRAARKNGRSVNQEVLLRVQQSFTGNELNPSMRLSLEATKALAEHAGLHDLVQRVETFLKEEEGNG
jgi:hypothetical protein